MSSILVTGGTGTFGRAFVRAMLNMAAPDDRVIVYSRDEVKQAAMATEFADKPALRMFLGDVRDKDRLMIAMQGVDTVVHAAALKRVDQGAYSPDEMIKTNITGTMNVVNAAIQSDVERVIVISSDKSVAATNIYGGTKFVAESYAISANSYSRRHASGSPRTRISAVRYGNVIGSRGSVIEKWRAQAARGEALSLTDPRMTRFIMTIEDAVRLVWFALSHMHGGEVFVPVLPSARMTDLAAVFSPDFTVEGMRPGGEKLAESLLSEEEPSRTYEHSSGGYYIVVPSYHEWTTGEEWMQEGETRRRLPASMVYRSDENADWLSTVALRAILDTTEAVR